MANRFGAVAAFHSGGRGPMIAAGLLVAAFLVFPAGQATAAVIPVSSEIALSANAGIDSNTPPEVFMQPIASQGATLNPLSLSVDNAVVFPQGASLLVGAACNPTAPNFCVSVDGQETAAWTSASHGTLTFSSYGWHDHLSTNGLIPPNAGTSNLIPGVLPLHPTEQFLYSFIAGPAGTMDIHYTVTNSGTDCVGLQPFDIDASGGSGTGPFGSIGLNNTCGTTSGDLTGTIDAGGSYNFFIKNQSNLSGGLLDRTAAIDATFDFTIPDSQPLPGTVPEPSSFILMGSMLPGALGYAWSRRRSIHAGREPISAPRPASYAIL